MRALVILFLAGLMACGGDGSLAPASLREQALHYRATTAEGRPLVEGTLRISVAPDSTVTGSWEIRWSRGADRSVEVGPQVGADSLAGVFRHDTLLIELNPLFCDYNVTLFATPMPHGWAGEWQLTTIIGVRNQGAFTATYD